MRPLLISLAVGLVLSSPATAKDPHPLFSDDSVIKVTITGPIREITRTAPRNTDPHPASLTLNGAAPETHAIALSARGNSRRDKNTCSFPPLRIRFNDKPDDLSFFDGQNSLKLVTHCKKSERFQQYYLLEYSAYKLLNTLTPLSLKVRLADIDYVDSERGKLVVSRRGFFIEDIDDAARRNGLKEIETPGVTVSQIDPASGGRYAVFQYMIGNLDWSMLEGPDGEDCCHNTKLMGMSEGATTGLVPTPYDFDYSGLVDAPYAVPPDNLRVRNVRTRRYRGFCIHNDEARAAAIEIRTLGPSLLGVIENAPGMDERTRKKAISYIEDFFDDIETDEKLEENLLRDCRD